MPKKRFFKDGKTVHPNRDYPPRRQRNKPEVETSSGIKVRSQYEKTVIEFFDRKSIRYQYEPLMYLNGKQYRPDFFLPDYNLFLEICGFTHMPHYRERIRFKENLYNENNLKAIFITYSGKGSLENILINQLQTAGIMIK